MKKSLYLSLVLAVLLAGCSSGSKPTVPAKDADPYGPNAPKHPGYTDITKDYRSTINSNTGLMVIVYYQSRPKFYGVHEDYTVKRYIAALGSTLDSKRIFMVDVDYYANRKDEHEVDIIAQKEIGGGNANAQLSTPAVVVYWKTVSSGGYVGYETDVNHYFLIDSAARTAREKFKKWGILKE